MRSHLVEGKVRHRRTSPFVYELEHDVYYAALELGELDEVARRHRLISRNGRNVLAFRDGDHWEPAANDLNATVRKHLRAEGFADADAWSITLISNLRVAGYVFNPASFYLCRDAAGELRVVIVEVHNTHLERKVYTLRPEVRGTAHVASMDKEHYVSPFIDMNARYTVRVRDEADRLQVVIDETENGTPLFQASMVLRRKPMTDRSLLRMLLRHPFMTQRTIGLIHWHALRLWRRGARFHSHGAASR
ncbi:DUF1365 domain-containing protein [soil metagenome]